MASAQSSEKIKTDFSNVQSKVASPLCRMDGCSADAALVSFTRQMKKLPAFLRESLTCDRGSEMVRHEDLAKRSNIDTGLCTLAHREAAENP